MASYDMDVLGKLRELDVSKARNNFNSRQEYFDRLTEFVDNAHDYLSLYNPTMVIYGKDIQVSFLDDLEKATQILTSLGMMPAVAELNNIVNAVSSNSVEVLSDGLIKFRADMEILSKRIAAARVKSETAAVQAKIEAVPDEKPLILAVDDKPEILSIINGILKDTYRVIAVTNAKIALEALEVHTPAMFLLDIEMPSMNGYELADQIRRDERFWKTPILFLTGNSTREYVITAMVHGGKEYILKPVDREVLLQKIRANMV